MPAHPVVTTRRTALAVAAGVAGVAVGGCTSDSPDDPADPASTSAPPVDADEESDVFQTAVTFHLGRLGVPVIAQFTVPEPRTIVMHIVEGEGVGSIVETHATPLGDGPDGRPRTAVIEAVIAKSERTGFGYSLRAAPLLRPVMRLAAARLWRDDLAYAERRYALRSKEAH